MSVKDSLGYAASGATAAALPAYETAVRQFLCYIEDPVASVDAALAQAPDFVMAHAFRAYLHLLGTEPAGLAVARASLEAAERLPTTERERGHLAAVRHLVAGRWQAASRALEDIAIAYPRDIVALQVGHLSDFFRGDSRMLRDRIARALPDWSPSMPNYHALLGMRAFGLEEMGHYAEAEAAGRKAVEIEPRDGWAQHAVAHVMEMQGRTRDGIAWMRAAPDVWSKDSALAVHNWWHLALYHLELGEIDEVLKLYDGPVYGKASGIILELIDASAMLWRLTLRGVPVGARWNVVADGWAPHAASGLYAFNDAHMVMAFAAAGRRDLIETVFAAQDAAMAKDDDNATMTREVGRPVCRALAAFVDGDYATTVQKLRTVRNIAARYGGSHAQRDLLDLTLIEAAFRAGQGDLARALAAERLALKPASPLARAFVSRAEMARAA